MVHGGDKDKLAGRGGAILTRRNLLELAGLAFATTAIPPGMMSAKAAASPDEAAQGVSPIMAPRYVRDAQRLSLSVRMVVRKLRR